MPSIPCEKCHRTFKSNGALDNHMLDKHGIAQNSKSDPDWGCECEVCGATPVHPVTGMCGPCTFGEADTAGGNW